MSFNLPNPSLLGILFIVSSHNGPQIIFNYPENLSNESLNPSKLDKDADDNSDDDEASDYYELYNYSKEQWDSNNLNYYIGTKKDLLSFLDDQEQSRKQASTPKKQQQDIQRDPLKDTTTTTTTTTTNNSNNNNDNNENNTDSSNNTTNNHNNQSTNNIFGIESDYLCEMLCPPKQMCNSRFEIMIDDKIFLGLPIHKYDNGSWRLNNRSKDDVKQTSLNMFHLVFIMNPPVIEYNYRIDEMFHYVISRLSLVLRYEQSKGEYISNQVKLILKLKEQFKDNNLFNNLINGSSLCKMIYDCFNSISQSKIANLSINNKLRSFQIPIKVEFHSLPEPTVPFLPGSYLSSTVNLLNNSGLINVGETTRYGMNNILSPYQFNDLDESTNSTDDVIYFALLLLDDSASIIKDIKTEPDSTLAKFIRMIKPTESLLKLSIRNCDLNLTQIKSFAFHLIYWRRARVIQPLSTRSVYIVSPMAPIAINIFNDIKKFKQNFPMSPSLPHFLKLLSSPSKKPKQFATIIPSKDHKDIYLSALSWLIRYGYVTQLQTFIWLKIPRKVKIKVEEDIENENLNKRRSNINKMINLGTDNTSKNKPKINSKATVDQEIDNIAKSLKLSSVGPNIILEEEDDTILIDPGRATTLERKWINKIIFDECKLSNELSAIFFKLLKYMNGKNSLELLLLKENISRSELRKLLFAIEDYIISVRHW